MRVIKSGNRYELLCNFSGKYVIYEKFYWGYGYCVEICSTLEVAISRLKYWEDWN